MIVWFKADQNKGPNFGDQIRGDSMISAFRMGTVASGRGLFDIDRVLFRVAKSRVKNWEVLARRKYTNNLGFQFDL